MKIWALNKGRWTVRLIIYESYLLIRWRGISSWFIEWSPAVIERDFVTKLESDELAVTMDCFCLG